MEKLLRCLSIHDTTKAAKLEIPTLRLLFNLSLFFPKPFFFLENFLIFVPMGIYLQMLLPRTKLYVKFMLIAGTSFLFETMQYILAVGRSDITDVLTNTAGGLLGLAVYSMAARLIGNRIKANRLFSILAGIVSVVVIGLLGFLLFANR